MKRENLVNALIYLFNYEIIDFEGMDFKEVKRFVRTDLTEESKVKLKDAMSKMIFV